MYHHCPSVPHLFIAYHQPPPFWTLYGHCHARPSGPPVATPGVHLRRKEEVISADDGNAESGRSAEEGAQRVAAALGSRGDGRRGWDTCMSSKLPSAYASRATNGGEGVLEGQPRTRMAFDK